MDDGNVSIQLKGDKTLSKQIPLIESYNNSSMKAEGVSSFLLYGLCSLGEVCWVDEMITDRYSSICFQLTEMFIYLDKIHRHAKWNWEYIVIYDYLNDKYYGTKASQNQYMGKMKLSVLNTIDPNHIGLLQIRFHKSFAHVSSIFRRRV